ncbi:hypothetical protein [Sutcliffiella cohnii]|uniref:hypothetical protein n=1 Tax=Sutcliffiella cohnii TaxID=33932 RepID=UPI002E1D19D2|nr:hypothetical protein [Sutcliffiella cohnii]
MGKLRIKQVIYNGEKFHYSSPILNEGLQILEAENGAGKTTFSSLISYGLGMYIKQFDFSNKEDYHLEILSDKNNYVLLRVQINNNEFELTRYFSSKNSNLIFVKGEKDFEESFPLFRAGLSDKEESIFSDWLLRELGIEVCEIYQGTKKFKINFSDLYRLMHYDQETNPSKIFKEHRTSGNFISDSTAVRKVIFELLIGYKFSEYYALIGRYNQLERERGTHKSTLENYLEMVQRMGFTITDYDEGDIKVKIKDKTLQIEKLELYKSELKTRDYTIRKYDKYIKQLRDSLFECENYLTKLNRNKSFTNKELNDLFKLKEDIILEVTQIRKIILAHKELNLFSPNTCPCCLKEIKREENHCICGEKFEENQYEKFFYDSEEYLDILKSKQKSVDTIDAAIKSCEEEIADTERESEEFELKKLKLNQQLKEIGANEVKVSNDNEINDVNERILFEKKEIQESEHQLELVEQYTQLQNKYNKVDSKLKKIAFKLNNMEADVEKLMKEQTEDFSKYYFEFLKETDNNIKTAELDDNYMPVINGGVYRQASSKVPKRFLYYLTLLKMALVKEEVPFPKFLLIDTPENLGIDESNLKKCIELISTITEEHKKNFQIILTTGIKKYPEVYDKYVVQTLTDENKLLSEKNSKKTVKDKDTNDEND